MVAPIESGRIAGAGVPPAPRIETRAPEGSESFGEALQRATDDLARATSGVAAQPLANAAEALHAIEQASMAMQRAQTHISSARAYFQSAGQSSTGGFDSRG